MESLFISTFSVALAEIGDKTQLLALVLAARFRRPVPIIIGMLIATLANHGFAGIAGEWISALLPAGVQQWLIAASFVLMGLWLLIPDSDDETAARYPYGAFLTTLIAFFLVEIGDKTQIATVVLAAHYDPLWVVVIGTTAGMLAANAPVVFMGGAVARRVPMRLVHAIAAGVFVILGVLAAPGVITGA